MKAINIFGIGVLATTYFILAKSKKEDEIDTAHYSDPTIPVQEPKTLNQDLKLTLGTKGDEVRKLQQLMGISADGTFGPLTQDKLYKLKGVKEISLKTFINSPMMNQNILKPGTNLMAKLKTGTPIYDAQAKADMSYFSNYTIVKTIDYGQEVGQIRLANPAGNWYSIYYPTLLGKKVGFVKSTDVEKF